jgi:hypothetical protein
MLNGFLGIEFGTSTEKAKEILLSREGVLFDNENSSDEALFFNGVTFAGRKTSYVFLLFVDNRFAKALVTLNPRIESRVIDMYKDIKSEINTKYFCAQDDFEIYEEPYFKDDVDFENGIRVGKITFSAYWSFENITNQTEDFISLRINEDMEIIISYESGYLTNIMVERKRKENQNDY